MKILYLPIYDPSHHAVAVANKCGLRNALRDAGHVVIELDYCAVPLDRLMPTVCDMLDGFEPELLLTQLQGVDRINAEQMAYIRREYRYLRVVNFNQDYWPEHHTTPDMLALLRHIDLQLVSNGSVLADYAANHVNAAYWPFGYETPIRPLPDVPEYDVLFLGNAYSEHRRKLGKLLKSLPYKVGLYGSGWEDGDGDCNYDFTYGEALYKKAKIAISDNEFTDAIGYLSNRPFQAMAAGCFVLQQFVMQSQKYTGIKNGVHVGLFLNIYSIPEHVHRRVTQEKTRQQIAKAGQQFVLEHHSYAVRVQELMALMEGLRV